MATVGDVALADSTQQAVVIQDAATASPALPSNLFSLQQSDVEGTDISGFFKGATVTIARDTSQAWHGVASLKGITTGGAQTFEQLEVRIPVAGQFVAGGVYTFSAWIFHPTGGPVLRYYLQANTGSIGTVGNITLLAGWNRYTFTRTLPNPITQQYFALRWDTGGTAQAVTLWMDGLQCEAGSVANPWTPGSIAAGVVKIADSAVHAVTIGDMRAP